LDKVTAGILTGGTDCFPSMHPGMVICLAWALMTGDSERATTLVDDAFDMMRHYGRPLSRNLWPLFDKGQGSPEPSPQQLLASFLRWAQEKHVEEMPQSIMTELVQAFAMVNARYEEEFDWASLVDVSDFDPLLGAHPVEGEFTLCPVAWMETLSASNSASKLYKQAENLVRVLQRNGIRVELDLDLIAQCILLAARTDRYDLTPEKVHVPKVVPPLAVLLGAKVAKAVRANVSSKWAAAREAHVVESLVEQVVVAVKAFPDCSPASVTALAAKLKEITFQSPCGGIKKVSRVHLAPLFDKLNGEQLKSVVMVFALHDSWTTESVRMLKSLSSNIVAVLGDLKDAFLARMTGRALCNRGLSNRHGHSIGCQAASVLDEAPPLRDKWPTIEEDKFKLMLETARAEVKKILATELSEAAKAKMDEFLGKNSCDVTSFQTPRARAPERGWMEPPPRSRAMRYLNSLQDLDAACQAYDKLATKPLMAKHQVYDFFRTPLEAMVKSTTLASLERRAQFWATQF
jgi:hypothetical protein